MTPRLYRTGSGSAANIGIAVAAVVCTALAGCSGSGSGAGQGTGTLPGMGTVSISGTFAAGETLTAVPSGFTLGTPEGSCHYTWQRCADSSCTSAIEVGADSATYVLAGDDAGFHVRAGVYVANSCPSGCGSSGTAYSAAAMVAGVLPAAGAVSIEGTFAVGQTLTAIPSGFTMGIPAGSYHYAWQRCADSGCTGTPTDVGTDSATYALAAADVDGFVRSGVYASNSCPSGCGPSDPAYSAATLVPGIPPTSGTVSIWGTFAVGETLTALPSGFTLGAPEGSYHYEWQRCMDPDCIGTPTVVGTDSATYALAAADVGGFVRAGVYASNACASGCGSSATAYSKVVPDLEWARWPMPDSATIFCTDGRSQITCPSSGSNYGQDGNYLVNSPSYTTSSETVLDNVTGLRWQRTVPSTTYVWADAKTYCAGLTLEGYVGWRLPTYVELVSILDVGRQGPAVDTAAFPNTPSEFFWSSSPFADAYDVNQAWSVSFSSGWSTNYPRTISYRVRCVR